MSMETAKKLIADLQINEDLKAKISGITDPAQLVKAAVDAGYDITAEEMIAAEKEFRSGKTKKTKLSVEELDAVAGGDIWQGEDAPDGHEMGCWASYHDYDYQEETDIWCGKDWYCQGNYMDKPTYPSMCSRHDM